ncbi:unnamed protein product [Rhodiola kirilowii]
MYQKLCFLFRRNRSALSPAIKNDILDVVVVKSQLLLSSSMDKTVRLWDLETKSCLKLFASQ